jgi:hypothetical protein
MAVAETDDLTLEEGMVQYEPRQVDVSITVDDRASRPGRACSANFARL